MTLTSNLNLKLASSLTISFGIKNLPQQVDSLMKNLKHSEIPPIVYLKGKSCNGCSLSLINFTQQSTRKLVVNHDNLVSLSGSISPHNIAIDLISRYLSGKLGYYFFALEGSIPQNPTDCYMANRPINDWIKQAGRTCMQALSFGNCAIVGNPNIRYKSETDQISLSDFFMKEKITKKVINIPGCPVSEEGLRNLIIELIKKDYPEIRIQPRKELSLHKNT